MRRTGTGVAVTAASPPLPLHPALRGQLFPSATRATEGGGGGCGGSRCYSYPPPPSFNPRRRRCHPPRPGSGLHQGVGTGRHRPTNSAALPLPRARGRRASRCGCNASTEAISAFHRGDPASGGGPHVATPPAKPHTRPRRTVPVQVCLLGTLVELGGPWWRQPLRRGCGRGRASRTRRRHCKCPLAAALLGAELPLEGRAGERLCCARAPPEGDTARGGAPAAVRSHETPSPRSAPPPRRPHSTPPAARSRPALPAARRSQILAPAALRPWRLPRGRRARRAAATGPPWSAPGAARQAHQRSCRREGGELIDSLPRLHPPPVASRLSSPQRVRAGTPAPRCP